MCDMISLPLLAHVYTHTHTHTHKEASHVTTYHSLIATLQKRYFLFSVQQWHTQQQSQGSAAKWITSHYTHRHAIITCRTTNTEHNNIIPQCLSIYITALYHAYASWNPMYAIKRWYQSHDTHTQLFTLASYTVCTVVRFVGYTIDYYYCSEMTRPNQDWVFTQK